MKSILLVIIIAVVFCSFIIIASRLYIARTYEKISRIIENSLAGKTSPVQEMQDTRESKIARQLRIILERAEYEKSLAKSEKDEVAALLSDLSHQLKTPLSNLTMYSELLRDENLTKEERDEFTTRICEQSNKMEWLTKMLIQISRLEVGVIEFEAVPNEFRETLCESISVIYPATNRKNIKIEVEEFKDCTLIHSKKWTKEVLINIFDNALKYSPENSKIWVRVVPMELYTKIMIMDEGIGIPKEEYNQIFKRFYRGKQVQEKEGTGLGLYLAQLIISKEGGYITVDSEVGKGSTFSVFLLNSKSS